MRYFEITSGVRIPLSAEEQAILDKAKTGVYKSDLDERDQEVARLMVSKGLLLRKRDSDRNILFKQNNSFVDRS